MLPEKTWKTESALQLLLCIYGTWAATVLLAFGLDRLNLSVFDKNKDTLNMVVGTMLFHGSVLFWIHYFLKKEGLSWREVFGFASGSPARIALLGFVAGILVLIPALLLQKLSVTILNLFSQKVESQLVVQQLQSKDTSNGEQIFLGFVALIGAPIVEELIFRGILYPTIKRAGYPRIALWGTSIFFAFTHQNLPTFLPLVFFALVLVFLYESTGNLLTPIVAHSCFNATNFVLLLVAKNFPALNP